MLAFRFLLLERNRARRYGDVVICPINIGALADSASVCRTVSEEYIPIEHSLAVSCDASEVRRRIHACQMRRRIPVQSGG